MIPADHSRSSTRQAFLRRIIGKSDFPSVVVVIVFLAYGLFLVARLSRHDFDPTFFVTAGENFVDAATLPEGFHVIKDSDGYDGQFYYRMAVSPFSAEQQVSGIRFDALSYRQQRILYPLISWVFSLGQETWVPWSLILVNFLGVCLLGYLGARFFRQKEIHALLGLVFPFYAGFVMTLARDLTEIIAAVMLMASLLKMDAGKWRQGGILLALAVLAKETTVGVSLVAGLILLLRSFRKKEIVEGQWDIVLFPVGVFLLNQAVLFVIWGEIPVFVGQGLGIPFYGFLKFVGEILQFETLWHYVWFLEVFFVLMLFGTAAFSFKSSKASEIEKGAWLSYLILAISVSDQVWIEDWAFMRALFECAIFSYVLILTSDRLKARIPVLLVTVFLWGLLAVRVQG